MAKDDTNAAGLFSKVVKFVRNPGTNWSDLDNKESDRESSYSKQALKEMIERKRRNDFVRKREFDMLRKLRRREASGLPPGTSDLSARPSFFQSSMPSKPDDRAMTLKKIDEIEAQMSMQWWKTKHGSNSALSQTSAFPNSDLPGNTNNSSRSGYPAGIGKAGKPVDPNDQAYARTAPDDFRNAIAINAAKAAQQAATAGPPVAPVAPVNRQPQPAPVAARLAPDVPAPALQVKPPAQTAQASPTVAPNLSVNAPKAPVMGNLAAYYEGGTTGFSASKLFALDVIDEVQHDPELEEAAIRFANGDDAGAEAGLLEALSPRGNRSHHEETWFTVFDLYRAIGLQDRFESMAIDFAGKFNRSAPMWFSIPEMVAKMASHATPAPTGARKADWRCPAVVGTQTVAALNAALAKATAPWCLDWTNLKTVEEAAQLPLTKLFATWAAQPVQLRFLGAGNLDRVLALATPSGVRETSQDLWKLRMEMMRITHRPDEFELTALDFCVTYEVSPPSWENARCVYKVLDVDGASAQSQTIIGDVVHDSITSGMGSFGDSISASSPSSLSTQQLAAVELSGQIQGDPVGVLDKLEARLAGADVMVISCAKLIRVDFSAAGTLLNWVSARQSEGRLVQFSDVHRLVAAFFHVIGISEHAKVVTRTD